MEEIIVLIPTYKPNKTILLDFLKKLKNKFKRILVVNDGSGIKYNTFFKEIEKTGITVLSYDDNIGKGRGDKNRNRLYIKELFSLLRDSNGRL